MLNDFRPEDNLATFAAALFGADAIAGGSFIKHVHVLLSWAVTAQQYGAHRPYLAVALLREWLLAIEHDCNRPGQISPPDLLQDTLFAWLDRSSAAVEGGSEFTVADLYGKLIESGLFSFEAYLQRLLVRDEKGMSFETVSTFLRVLRLGSDMIIAGFRDFSPQEFRPGYPIDKCLDIHPVPAKSPLVWHSGTIDTRRNQRAAHQTRTANCVISPV